MTPEREQHTEVLPEPVEDTGYYWSPEERQEIADYLSTLLDRRAENTMAGSEARLGLLQEAVERLPEELDTLIRTYETALDEAGVSSFAVYVLGGFAREATGQQVDPDTGMDTSIRSDTDIDVMVVCTPKKGIKIIPYKIPSPFTPILRQWYDGDLGRTVELAFGVTGTPKDLKPDRPSIPLLQHDLSST